MYKVGDRVVRVNTSNLALASPVGTEGVIERIDRGDKTYKVKLLTGGLEGTSVWWFHNCTKRIEPETPVWEV